MEYNKNISGGVLVCCMTVLVLVVSTDIYEARSILNQFEDMQKCQQKCANERPNGCDYQSWCFTNCAYNAGNN